MRLPGAKRARVKVLRHAALTLLILLAACSQAPLEPTLEAGPTLTVARPPAPLPVIAATATPVRATQIAIWTDWDPVELEALRAVLALYSEAHPGVEFSLAFFPPGDLLDAYLNCLAEGGCPSILIGPSSWGPLLVEQDGVTDISAFIDAQLQRDLYPIAWSQVDYDGTTAGLPLELQGIVLYRNASLVPTRNSQLSGLIRDADALRTESLQPSVFDFSFTNALPFITACGGDPFSPQGELKIDNEAGLCWLGLLSDWGGAGRVVVDSSDDRESFVGGTSGWLIDTSLAFQALTRALSAANLKVDPWPVLDATGEPLKGFVWTENVYLAPQGGIDELEANWEFARFLFDPAAQALLSDPAGPAHIPVQESVILQDPAQQTISDMLRSGVPYPLRNDLARFSAPVNALIGSVIQKGAEPLQALGALEASLQTATPTPAFEP